MQRGVTHGEYIRAHADGRFYFLEIAARVGGAFIADLVEHSTGVNLWREWAKIEVAHLRGEAYRPPSRERIRRQRPLPGQGRRARHIGLQRPRDRLSHEKAPPRRPDRSFRKTGTRSPAAGRIQPGLRPPIPCQHAPTGPPHRLKIARIGSHDESGCPTFNTVSSC
jgi:hypothetical protein